MSGLEPEKVKDGRRAPGPGWSLQELSPDPGGCAAFLCVISLLKLWADGSGSVFVSGGWAFALFSYFVCSCLGCFFMIWRSLSF